MRIGVVGAGAIGCAVAARLSHAGHDVSLVVRSEARRALLAERGLTCIEEAETLVSHPNAVAVLGETPLDILFLAVKAADLPAAVAAVPAAATAGDTLVVPLVNGIPWWLHQRSADQAAMVRAVDPEGALLSRFPASALAGSVVYTTAMLEDPATVRVMRSQVLVLGSIAGDDDGRIERAATMLREANIAAQVSTSIRDDVWTKVALNLATNPLSVVTQAALGTLCSDDALLPLVEAVLDETWQVAGRYDARPVLSRSQMLARGRAAGAFRTSMLEDYANGRPLELAAIADAVFELAGAVGIDMPVARAVVELARFRASQRPKENVL